MVHASIHSPCHHQTILFERTVCHFSQANPDHIKRSPVDLFDWESALTNLDANEQVSVFSDTIANAMSNFVPNEILIC